MIKPTIITETDNYYVINKPAGWAVEKPAKGSTIGEWLIENKKINSADWQPNQRDGIVHRLDTDTSGVLIWAKSPASQTRLQLEWQGRRVKKTYLALVIGEIQPHGTVDLPLKRDNRKDRQMVDLLNTGTARPALTEYTRRAVGEWQDKKVSLVECHPVTGRTHQLRVHLKAIGHPIIGDHLYGEKGTNQIAKGIGLARQFLHAWQIELENHIYQADLPADLETALTAVGIPPQQVEK